MPQDASIARVGSAAAFGVALAYFASGVCAVLMPAELQGRPDITPHEFWTVLVQHPTAHLAYHASWVVAGFCGLAAVLWSGSAAWLGFAVLARSHLMELAFDRKVIPHYLEAGPAYQEAVHVVAGLALDVPDGFLTYGAIGAWVACTSALALRARLLPRPLCVLGFVAALTYLAGVLGYTFSYHPFIVLSVGVGGFVVVPAWFAGLGLALRRAGRSA